MMTLQKDHRTTLDLTLFLMSSQSKYENTETIHMTCSTQLLVSLRR